MSQHQVHEVLVPDLPVPPPRLRRRPAVMHPVIAPVVVVPRERHIELVDHTAGYHPSLRQFLHHHAVERLHLARIEREIPRVPSRRDRRPVEQLRRRPIPLLPRMPHHFLPKPRRVLRSLGGESLETLPVDPVVQTGVQYHHIRSSIFRKVIPQQLPEFLILKRLQTHVV